MSYTRWSSEMTAALRAAWPHSSALEVATRLGLTKEQVVNKAFQLGLSRRPRGGRYWERNARIIACHATLRDCRAVAAEFGLTAARVRTIVREAR